MGNTRTQSQKMKVFVCLSALLAAASAAPSAQVVGYGGGQTSHQSVSRPYGEQRSIVQSKAFGAAHASVTQVDNSKGLSEIQPAIGANKPIAVGHAAVIPVATHAVHAVHAPVYHAAPVVHAAPAYHPPIVHAAPAYHAPAYPDEPSPYTYTYAVADDYSNSNFNAAETGDGNGNAEGSYSVALPDGRTQHVNYKADGYAGYVADVTYDGAAVYPDAPAPYHAAPVPAYAG